MDPPLGGPIRAMEHKITKKTTGHGCAVMLFLTFSVLVANPKKLLYTVANPARGLLNREKRTK